jgi:phosphomannomutase
VAVFVDASNGCGTELLTRVFNGVANLSFTSINTAWTDAWAHEPNPLVAANMVPTQSGVQAGRFDLGACFDGDADRCMFSDETGALVGCDHLTAALASTFLQRHPGAAVGYDLRSSKAVAEAVVAAGGQPVMAKVGHVNIKKLLRDTGAVFAGELSGHFYFRENACCDSGAITLAIVAGVVSRAGQPLSALIAPHRKYPQSGERNFRHADIPSLLAQLETSFAPGAEVHKLDGLTLDAWSQAGWWINIRASNTEPLLRLNAEARDESTLTALLTRLLPLLGDEDHGH